MTRFNSFLVLILFVFIGYSLAKLPNNYLLLFFSILVLMIGVIVSKYISKNDD